MNCFSKSSLDYHHSPCPLKLEDVKLVSCIPSPVSVVLDKNSSDEKVVETENNGLECGKVALVVKSILKKPAGGCEKGVKMGRVQWMDFVGKELVEIREFKALESRGAEERLNINLPVCVSFYEAPDQCRQENRLISPRLSNCC